MRGQAVALAVALAGLAAPACAQSEEAAEDPRTAEQFIETAREVYTVNKPEPDPCPKATGTEIVVCRQLEDPEQFRIASPTERAYAADAMPPDPIPSAPDVFGLPPCSAYQVCVKMGRTPPPIYIIDLEAIPEALTPEEAAFVVRAEDRPGGEEAAP